ncbi:MAG: M3 family oligoendopeptidase [Anaerolineae bacterium]|nr:M3 family oligoendopeptidase [Anaerolineae bacterium]
MFNTLPDNWKAFLDWPWEKIAPYFDDLASRDLTADTVESWLLDWTRLADIVVETRWWLYINTTLDTTDEAAQKAVTDYLTNIFNPAQSAEQVLKQKLLASGLEPEGFELPLKRMRTEAAIFREENLDLETEEHKLVSDFERTVGTQTIVWDGEEKTLRQLEPVFIGLDRDQREKMWRVASERNLEDRAKIDEIWVKLMALRRKIAVNAGFDDYRAYRWQYWRRFDYTPEDCLTFHAAIEEVVVPVVAELNDRHRQHLGVEVLRPWDLGVDLQHPADMRIEPLARPPLRPFKTAEELEQLASSVFHKVDPELGEYFEMLRRVGHLDLPNRKGKGPGAYCQTLDATGVPFVFLNAVGIHDDVQTMLHEGGHAMHALECAHLPYHQQRTESAMPMEVAEVASMAMELIAAPYLLKSEGGVYSEEEYARARVEHLQGILRFLPYMATVDAFQHWVYTHHDAASDPANCDAQWAELWDRFVPGVDYTGLEDVKVTGWHNKPHIFSVPFYYVDYGLAQVGALQVWRNALADQSKAVKQYRAALKLGGMVNIPTFYETAGVKFAFDAATLHEVVDLAMDTIEALEG